MRNAIFGLFCLLSVLSQAQEKKYKSYYTLSGGLFAPVGKMASSQGERAGYAGVGRGFSFEYYQPAQYVGWMAGLSYGNLPVKISEGLKNQAPGIRGGDSAHWMASSLMAGFGQAWAMGNLPITLDAKLAGGFYFGKAPKMNFTDPANVPDELQKLNNTGWDCFGTLGLQVGVGANWHLDKHTAVRLSATLLTASPMFDIVGKKRVIRSGEITYEPETFRINQPTNILQIQAGVIWKVKRKSTSKKGCNCFGTF